MFLHKTALRLILFFFVYQTESWNSKELVEPNSCAPDGHRLGAAIASDFLRLGVVLPHLLGEIFGAIISQFSRCFPPSYGKLVSCHQI